MIELKDDSGAFPKNLRRFQIMKAGKKIVLTFIPILLALTTFSSVALAAPSIMGTSGKLVKGDLLAISGDNFLSHPDYHANVGGKLNWLWQDWETAIEYDGLGTNYPASWALQSSGGRTWVKHSGPYGNVQGLQTKNYPFSTGVYFQSTWIYVPSAVSGGKTIRYRFNNQKVDYWFNLAGGNLASDAPVPGFTYWGPLSECPKNQWYRLDMLLTNSPKTQKFWVVGINSNNPIDSRTESSITIAGTVELNLGAGLDDSYFGFDDVYADFTQARVEICNSATWSGRKHCEIQLPVAWANSSIKVRVNPGSFAQGNEAYLYVVDQNGSVNVNGYPVTIGGGGLGETVPSPPTGLKILP
jgi:hypothetical protein